MTASRPPKTCGPGMQQAIWDRVWAEAERDKAKAPDRVMDPDTNQIVRDSAIRAMARSIEQLACEKYAYWEHRAWTQARTGWGELPLDPAARQEWLDAGGKQPKEAIGLMRMRTYAQTSPNYVASPTMKKKRRTKRESL